MDMTRTDDTPKTGRERIRRLAASRRARVPLALIGVLLLVTSVLVVGSIETREEPNPDVDASVAIDQTEAAAGTALRDGAQRAAEIAAEQPLTAAADNEWGAVLDADRDGPPPIHPSRADDELADDTFKSYLEALIYLEVGANLEQTGQEVDDISTDVSVPAIENEADFADAVDRVTLTESAEGTLDVTVENITFNATHDGELIEQREMTMNVTIATPIMQLHERVRTFGSALKAGVTERGFSQRFNARIYAIGWARGYMQNARLPVVEVIANRHIEPSANSALYRTQQDVFGAADPDLGNAVRLGWTCMALQDGGAMFDEYMDSNDLSYGNLSHDGDTLTYRYDNGTEVEADAPVDGSGTADGLCEGVEWLLGDQVTGQHPEAPGVTDLLGNAPGMNENETIAVNEAAYIPMARMVETEYDDSFVSAIDRIYTIEGDADSASTVADGLSFSGSASCDFPANRSGTYRSATGSSVTQTSIDTLDTPGEQYYEATSVVSATVRKKLRCSGESNPTIDTDSLAVEVTSTFSESDPNPDATIDDVNDVGIDPYKYEPGATTSLLPSDFRNYDGADQVVTEEILGGEIGTGAHADWVDRAVPDGITEASDVTGPVGSDLNYRTEVDIDHDEFLEAKLAASMAEDIRSMQSDVAEISYEFSRSDLIRRGDESPFARLIETVKREMRETYLERDEPYRSVGQKAIYEARHAYLQTLIDELELLEEGHDEAIATVDDELNDLDSGVDNALTFLQQGVSADEPDPIPLESSELTRNITYEVSGSPTYLVADNLTKRTVPAVEAGTEFVPFAMKNKEYVDLPYEQVVGGLLDRLANVIGLGGPDAKIGFQTAGDVLLAGDLAVETGNHTEYNPSNASRLESELDDFESTVDSALDEFYGDVAAETVIELYPSDVAKCRVLAPPPAGDANPDRIPANCPWIVGNTSDDLLDAIDDAEDAIEEATRQGVDGFGEAGTAVAMKAVAIGRGNATEPIIDNVTDAIDDGVYRYDEFDANHDPGQWEYVVDSAVRPAVTRASTMKVDVGSPEDAEFIDHTLQTALENVTGEMIEERLEGLGDDVEDVLSEKTEEWAGKWSGTRKRPARVPAGVPLLPLPGYWYATMNVWDIEVEGEYARFEASASMGTPEHTTATTYVRENMTVVHKIAGEARTLGRVAPINLSGRSHLVVITPPGVGVGDRDDENPECSPQFPHVGEYDPNKDDPQCERTEYANGVNWTEQRQESDGRD
jgi:hypothetical protein